jgi:hypothetical protein
VLTQRDYIKAAKRQLKAALEADKKQDNRAVLAHLLSARGYVKGTVDNLRSTNDLKDAS